MKANAFRPIHSLAVLTLLLAPTVTYAMSGMETPTGGQVNATTSLSQSMGEPINSSESEIEMTYSVDGKTAVFVSGRQGSIPSPGVPYNFDIWMSHNMNGTWQAPIHLGPGIDPTVGPNINTSAWELEPSLSDDGNVIYFTRYEPGNLSTGDLYVTKKINGVWQKPQSLGPRINSPYRDHMHWTGLSKYGKSLIITSTRPDMGSRGGHDMWISYQNPKGEWQEPLNLGDTINTAGEDMCWAFSPDGKTFSGGSGPRDSYNHDILWVHKDNVPLLKNFEPIGPPPNLLTNSKMTPSATK